MKIKHVLSTIAVSTALAFTSAAHASHEHDVYSSDSNFAGALVDKGGMSINDKPSAYANIQVDVYDMVNTVDPRQTFLAFCFQPEVGKSAYLYAPSYAVDTSVVSNKVRALYERQYESTIGNTDRQFSFQLALWELVADDGKLYDNTGLQYFSQTGKNVDARVGVAADMLADAAGVTKLDNTYLYTIFRAADGSSSQVLIGAAPVPEADSWAMLAAGLGLVGFVGRRKSKKSEKFAA